MNVEEYYPTKCEVELIERNKEAILATMEADFNLVDLGAGDAKKTYILLRECQKQGKELTYIPVDISQGSNEKLAESLSQKLPKLNAHIITGEFEESLRYVRSNFHRQSLIVMFGLSIGNMTKAEAEKFLANLLKPMKQNDLLMITFDLKKDFRTIQLAYNDPRGVAEEFEMNILHRINSELGGNFPTDQFFFHSYLDSYDGCIKNFLISKIEQDVRIYNLERSFHFEAFEPILVEESHKFTLKEIEKIAQKCGATIANSFYDKRQYIVSSLWRKQ